MTAREAMAWCLVAALGAPVGVTGDADGNGVVNFDDNNAVLAHWGETGEAWAEHVCDCPEIVGPPEPTEVERLLAEGKVYTDGNSNGGEGWRIDGADNRVLISVRGETEWWAEQTGARTGGVKFVTVTPDFTLPVGSEP